MSREKKKDPHAVALGRRGGLVRSPAKVAAAKRRAQARKEQLDKESKSA